MLFWVFENIPYTRAGLSLDDDVLSIMLIRGDVCICRRLLALFGVVCVAGAKRGGREGRVPGGRLRCGAHDEGARGALHRG